MKNLLILALWSAGALGGPCQPAETSGAISSSQGPDQCDDEIAETPNVSLVEIQPEQDTTFAAPVTTEPPDEGNGQVPISVTFTEVSQASTVPDNPGLPPPGQTEPADDEPAPATTSGVAPGIIGEASNDPTSAAATNIGSVNSETVLVDPGNQDPNTQTTEGQSNETQNPPSATSSGNINEGQSIPVPTSGDSNSPPTTTAHGQDTATDSKSPEETLPSNTQAPDTGNTSVTDTLPGNTQSPTSKAEDGTRTTNHGDDTTSKSATDNHDTSSLQVSESNDQSSNKNTATTTMATSRGQGDDSPRTETKIDDIPPNTSNPVTTTAHDAIPAPTVTDLPPGLAPATITGHPEWVSNTWITTSSGSSEPTVVPVLVGCPGCGGKGSGIILFGFPKVPGTWFKLPGLPKFKFPCIPPVCTTPPDTPKDGDDGDKNDDDDDDDKSSSATCTAKATVTDCLVACTTYTGPAGSTITPECKTTCTKTHTGCDIVGTTTTSSAAACGPSGNSSCKSCERKLIPKGDPEEEDGDGPEENTEEDSEDSTEEDSERLQQRGLKKRGPRKAPTNIGGCEFERMPAFPEYPGGELVLNNDAVIIPKNSPLKDIKKWWLTTKDENCLLELKGNLAADEYKSLRGVGDEGRPSIDHVYEKSMLLDFFRYIINKDENAPNVKGATDGGARDKISCSDMEAYGGVGSESNNLLQKVFDAFPGAVKGKSKNPTAVKKAKYLEDFIGMDQWTNGDAKGFVANAEEVERQCTNDVNAKYDVKSTTSEADATSWINEKIEKLEKLAIGVAMFSATEARDAMIRQNHRIHAALVDMDMNAKGCMDDPAVKNGLWSFSNAYQTFMASRFDGTASWSINHAVDQAKTKLIEKLDSDLNEAPNVAAANQQEWNAKVEHWKLRLRKMTDSTTWAVPVPSWTWQSVTKRDGDGLSCKRPVPTSTSSEEPTTFSTMTRSDGSSQQPSSEEIHYTTKADTSTSSPEVTTSSTKKSGPTIGQRPGWLTDAPTLTDRLSPTISTPDGSSCTKTVTETMCNLGTGRHGKACVTHSRCESWVNTKTTSKPSPSPTMASPQFTNNILRCNKDSQVSNPNAIAYAAQSFCRDVVAKNKDNAYYWSNDRLEGKKVPSTGYHFKLSFSVRKDCLWKANYDQCMRYMDVAINGCNGRKKEDKLGGWVRDNCIEAIINPMRGI